MGTISSDQSLRVKYLKGGTLGSVEESFLSRLKPGDPFVIGGKVVELVRVREMTAYVRRAKRKRWNVPRWVGGRLPMSTELGHAVRRQMRRVVENPNGLAEFEAVQSLFALQQQWSHVPDSSELLIEQFKTRDGYYTVLFPFEGRAVHEGLASLWAYRLGQSQAGTYGSVVNDYAVALVSPEPIPQEALCSEFLADVGQLPDDIVGSLNLSQMTRQRFRDIARIAGLVFGGFPSQNKSTRQLQASSNLFFDVFEQYDPQNLLLEQARREVLATQLQWQNLERALESLVARCWRRIELRRPSPFSFPLVVERMRDRISTETLGERVRKMQASLEREAGRPMKPTTVS